MKTESDSSIAQRRHSIQIELDALNARIAELEHLGKAEAVKRLSSSRRMRTREIAQLETTLGGRLK